MDKIWLIIKREYLTRVMKKSFLLVTLLTPIAFGALMFLGGYFAANQSSEQKVAIVDQSGILSADKLPDGNTKYEIVQEPISEIKKNYQEKGYDVLVNIPAYTDMESTKHQVSYYSKEKMSIFAVKELERTIEKIFKDYKLDNSSFDKEALAKLEIDIKLENALLTETDESVKGDKSSNLSKSIATGISYFMGFLMYMVIFIFGSMVMRSVMEEKINRIVEVMISSVKPFQLLMGKVMGVGLVGLTQLAIWIILGGIIIAGVSGYTGGGDATELMNDPNLVAATEALKDDNQFEKVLSEIKSFNWWLIIPSFVIFFFGGYFIYSALFAAVGSAVGDDLAEGQQLTLPIVLPVIIAFFMVPSVISDSNGAVAIFGSLFPLTSPIVMPARLPMDPPIWQVILSIALLILGIIAVTWLAARIYRVGIFMYGKKTGFKEIAKWITYKG